ncbi:hypothetical protein K9N68_15725 [Kovacikia minuta CCNUW1]|uniref:hypothetical protein n=1 Tax=Kovacikia minuta TaxID=2931930 RepID=UPI001CCAC563|nr:hypothetical protein [Kovacikia minuta]UBF29152.1 hypothetical protein K9N68_15725 [Kovacikia minuta CCNUW1]
MKRLIVSALLAVPLAIASVPKEASAVEIIIAPAAPVQYGGGGVGLGVWIPGYWGYESGRRHWYPGRWDRSRHWDRDRDDRKWDRRWNRDRYDSRYWERRGGDRDRYDYYRWQNRPNQRILEKDRNGRWHDGGLWNRDRD